LNTERFCKPKVGSSILSTGTTYQPNGLPALAFNKKFPACIADGASHLGFGVVP
jgi:hypothetical protein